MVRIFFTILLSITFQIICGQSKTEERIAIAYLNTDNFFDIIDDQGEKDNNYTPDGTLGWNSERYSKKVEDIATILTDIYSEVSPSIIVLSGIEKIDIVRDILSSRKLRKSNYEIAGRNFYPGSGFVILVEKGAAKLLENRVIVQDINQSLAEVSLLTYNKIELNNGETYHLFVNEWPRNSIEGISGEILRKQSAASLRKEVDLILNFERKAKIIVMGSFNDEPTNSSIMNILNSSGKRKNIGDRDLYNPYFDLHNFNNTGTIEINGTWQMYDFIMVSPSLLNVVNSFNIDFGGGKIAAPGSSFGPTYRGDEYMGGSGAHLPVYIELSRIVEK